MPNELWSAVGALLIATAMLATHPIKPVVAQHIETRIAANWSDLHPVQSGCPADLPCRVPYPTH